VGNNQDKAWNSRFNEKSPARMERDVAFGVPK
jgi:hypothetical protein